jgi:hypothetical protein
VQVSQEVWCTAFERNSKAYLCQGRRGRCSNNCKPQGGTGKIPVLHTEGSKPCFSAQQFPVSR